ncbi:MAG: TIGR03621 family F420-dependent LLM class oxidoreductase, partial [Acidimicrobiales bacterium]
MGLRPFRFGAQFASAADGRTWRERAKAAEDLGYATFWMPDHLDDQWGPLVGLTAAAAATTTIRIGALVFDNDFRHPAVLAKEMATLDLVSEGRLELGIGAGWLASDYVAHGLAFDPPHTRVERLEEAVQVVKGLWSGQPATFDGHHYRLDRASGWPRPVQAPHPPIMVAGGSRKVLGVAAREADIVGFNTSLAAGAVGPDAARSALAARFHERVAWVKEAAGDRFDELELQCNTAFCLVGVDRWATARAVAPGFGITPEEALDVPIALVGSVDEICATLERRREEFGFSYWAVPGDAFEAFAPVV